MNARARILGSALGTSISNLGAAGIALALSIVVARQLGPSLKGSFDLLVTTSAFAALGFGLGVPIGIILIVARNPEIARKVPYPAATFAVLVGLVTAGALAALQRLEIGLIPTDDGQRLTAVVAVGLLAAGTVYTAIAEAALIGSGRIGLANLSDLAARFSGLVLVIALSTMASPANLVIAMALGLLVGAVIQSAALGPRGWIDRSSATATVRQALPAYVSSGMQLLNYRLDLFIVAFFWGAEQVGLYAVAGLLAQFVWVLARGAATGLYPLFAVEADPAVGARRVAEASRIASLLGVVVSVALALVAPIVIPAIYGAAFSDSVVPLWLLLPGAAVLSPAIIASAYFLGRGAPRINLLTSGIGLLVTVVLDLAVVPIFGMAGAALVSTLSYGATAIASFVLLRRATQLTWTEMLVPRKEDFRRLAGAAGELGRRSRLRARSEAWGDAPDDVSR